MRNLVRDVGVLMLGVVQALCVVVGLLGLALVVVAWVFSNPGLMEFGWLLSGWLVVFAVGWLVVLGVHCLRNRGGLSASEIVE